MQQDQNLITEELELGSNARASLNNAANWARFIAIFMLISCVIFLLVILAQGSEIISGYNEGFQSYRGLSPGSGLILFVVFLLAGIVFTVIFYYLLSFSLKIKPALIAEDTKQVNKGLGALKIYFIISGIIGILFAFINFLAFGKLL